MSRRYDGPPIDDSWQSDIVDRKVVAGSNAEEKGQMTTDDWPSAVPEDPFIDDRYDHESDKHKIVRTLALNPDASSEEIADIVGCGEQWVDKVRSFVSVFTPPKAVEFHIPELPWDDQKTNQLIDHPQSRFVNAESVAELREGHEDRVDDTADKLADQDDTNSSDSSQQSPEGGVAPPEEQSDDESRVTDQTREILGRNQVLGQKVETIAQEMGLSKEAVSGAIAADKKVDEAEYIVPDDAEGSERRATVGSEVDDPEVMENGERGHSPETDPETAHTTSHKPSDSTAGDDDWDAEEVLGGAAIVLLLWIGYRLGRWRAGGDAE